VEQWGHFRVLQPGMHREIIADLQELADARPGDFCLTCMLVTVLVRSGCPDEAGDLCYRALRYADRHNFDPAPQR
jgi:hypothetical protein